MFTGIIECLGSITSMTSPATGFYLTLACPPEILVDAALGDSIALNGVCLTITEFTACSVTFGISPETLRKTNLGALEIGDAVNLERAMSIGQSGHFVQGHVDTTVKILSVVPDPPNSLIYTFEIDKEWARYVVGKGYVCLDGTSLTVVEVGKGVFSIMLIEYTQGKVIMTGKKAGDLVNLEVDQMGKYCETVVLGMLAGKTKNGASMIEDLVEKIVENKIEKAFAARKL